VSGDQHSGVSVCSYISNFNKNQEKTSYFHYLTIIVTLYNNSVESLVDKKLLILGVQHSRTDWLPVIVFMPVQSLRITQSKCKKSAVNCSCSPCETSSVAGQCQVKLVCDW